MTPRISCKNTMYNTRALIFYYLTTGYQFHLVVIKIKGLWRHWSRGHTGVIKVFLCDAGVLLIVCHKRAADVINKGQGQFILSKDTGQYIEKPTTYLS